jgi:predicted Zn-dependent protease
MLDICKTDDELASVLAHEVAHVLSRHAVRVPTDSSLAEIMM